ncbi:class D sortase [Oceanobacillus sp. CAU 1775]
MKVLSYIFITIGIVLLAFGGYQWLSSTGAQNQAAAEAKTLIKDREKALQAPDAKDLAKNFNPVHGETVGNLLIPKIDAELPIIEGTDPDELSRGVGHYYGTAYPLQEDQIVLSGHRDTVFRRTGELEIGDQLTLQLKYGDFTYEITETKIVSADDLTIIVPHDEEVLTLTTCYPFSLVGNAPDRYIIYAYPVSKNE